MTGEGPIFLPMYARPDLRPVAIIGWVCALISAITVYTWIVVQINDGHYEGVSNSRCHIVKEYLPDDSAMAGKSWQEVSRHLEVLTDERDDVHSWHEIAADCAE
jgi:hypothetical protein